MNCELITIGDELLIGQVVDTNSAWMAAKLNAIGIRVVQITSVSDSAAHIMKALDAARERADIILMTGGLGPTRDDLTKGTLCTYFDSELKEDPEVLARLEGYFKVRGRELTPTNREQAMMPVKCRPIYNNNGTAAGMWFDDRNQVFVSMPGVPYEMKAMMEEDVVRALSTRFKLPEVFHFTILTIGVGESFLSDMISSLELSLPPYLKLAYLPSPGVVKLRLSCYEANAKNRAELLHYIELLKPLIYKYIFGFNDETLEGIIASLMKAGGNTLSIAESCTGGYISHLITTQPGSSAYYIGSSISYANEVKSMFLGVDPQIIEEKGAVSEEVAKAMADGVRAKLGSTWAISTTGIAGPGGGTEEKPVGTVWIGISGPDRTFAHKFRFGTDRIRNIQMSAAAALNLLRKEMVNENGD